VHGVIEGRRDATFRRILNRAALVLPDGMPLVWFGRLRGHRGIQRVYGPGFMEAVLARTAGAAVRHFFYGGQPGVAEDLARRMSARFPGLKIAGTYCPPFRPLSQSELEMVARTINEAGPDIVWVGLSTPKQERWIAEVRERLRAKVVVSVGAAFDYHTGRLRQAPAWMQRAALEWLFRLWQEPGRLWRRYAVNNPRFLGLAVLQLAGLAEFPVDEGGDTGFVAPGLS
jgi:N-acetylglucosaminyldiphosphoundecaprenol N-acetyl-beta-D-mannosaminyltransferase